MKKKKVDPPRHSYSVLGATFTGSSLSELTADQLIEAINHPSHYQNTDPAYEAIRVIEAWESCSEPSIQRMHRRCNKTNEQKGTQRMKRGKVLAIVGAQWGSEAKGACAHHLADQFELAVRTGGPNAGHSIVHEGQLFKMQSLPVGWVNPKCTLVLGAGAVISPEILMREMVQIKEFFPDICNRIVIDGAATILDPKHHQEEGGVDGELHLTMGSTGEGVGAARRGRMMRDPNTFRLARDCAELGGFRVHEDTAGMLTRAIRNGTSCLLEGTQGCGLSLIHGSWPHVTTADTNAAQFAADAGIPPGWVTTALVARTYPIRVAGPSGPMYNEMTWNELSTKVGKPVLERTTVTKKIRRIGSWDEPLFRKAVALNDPSWVALTFMDYFSPKDEGVTKFDDLSDVALGFIGYVERSFEVYVRIIGTGWSPTTGWTCVDRENE